MAKYVPCTYIFSREMAVFSKSHRGFDFFINKQNVCRVFEVNNINDQLDATITILLIFESAQHVSGK